MAGTYTQILRRVRRLVDECDTLVAASRAQLRRSHAIIDDSRRPVRSAGDICSEARKRDGDERAGRGSEPS